MTGRFCCCLSLFALLSVLPCFAGDQQKAEKQLRKISAMAADVTARGIVSRSMADLLDIPRAQLVRERRAMNLSYGSVFLAHHLAGHGIKMLDIALQLQHHKNILQIANEQHLDWKQVASDAKKLNGKFEDAIYKHFLRSDPDKSRDLAEKYDATQDWVNADREVTEPEVEEAQAIYVLWRDRAGTTGGTEGVVTSSERLASSRLEEQAHDVGRLTGRAPTPK
jgi:hypothetical protein